MDRTDRDRCEELWEAGDSGSRGPAAPFLAWGLRGWRAPADTWLFSPRV